MLNISAWRTKADRLPINRLYNPNFVIPCQSNNPLKSRNKLIYDFDITSFQPGKSLTKIAEIKTHGLVYFKRN